MNGVFGFTPDGYPLHRGAPRPRAASGSPSRSGSRTRPASRADRRRPHHRRRRLRSTTRPPTSSRFDERELDPAVFEARCDDQYRDVYVAHHPVEPHDVGAGPPLVARSPSAAGARRRVLRRRHVGAPAVVRGERRPRAATCPDTRRLVVARTGRRSRSPSTSRSASAAGCSTSRRSRGSRSRVRAPRPSCCGWSRRAATDRSGTVRYSVLLDERGGIRSDVTVARFAEDRFVLGGERSARPGVAPGARARPMASAIEPRDRPTRVPRRLGPARPRGPRSRIADGDLSDEAFPYLTCRARPGRRGRRRRRPDLLRGRARVGAQRARPRTARRLWDAVWPAAPAAGMVAAGRAALGSLRIEKGYRAWGTDLTPEHGPDESGLGFTVRRDGSDFLGRDGLAPVRLASPAPAASCSRARNRRWAASRSSSVTTSSATSRRRPGDRASASRSRTRGSTPRSSEGADVDVLYFERAIPGRLVAEPRFDPAGERLRG